MHIRTRIARSFGCLLACAMMLGVGACGAQTVKPVQDAQGATMYPVKINEAFQSLLYLPLYVAKDKGLFAKHGIVIDGAIGNSGTGGAALTTVLRGDAGFALGGPENVAYMNARGGKTVSVSTAANSAPTWIVSRDGTPLKSVADLKGHSVSVSAPGTTTNTLLKEGLKAAGMTYGKDVRVHEVQQGSEISTVVTGRTQYAIANEPYISQSLEKGLRIVYSWTSVYPEYAYSTFMTSRAFVEKNPQVVQRFVASINDALHYIHGDRRGSIAVARAWFPALQPSVLSAAVQRMIDSNVYPESALITPQAMRTAMQRQINAGNLKAMPEYTNVVNPLFATRAESKS